MVSVRKEIQATGNGSSEEGEMTPRRPPGEGIGDGLLGGLTHAFKFEGWEF